MGMELVFEILGVGMDESGDLVDLMGGEIR